MTDEHDRAATPADAADVIAAVTREYIWARWHWSMFVLFTVLCICIDLGIWLCRIIALTNVGAKMPFWSALYEVMCASCGGLSAFATLIAVFVMGIFWKSFRLYLRDMTRKEPDANEPLIERLKRNARAALHDPPGDIFTLVGIAFTFVGLAIALVSISIQDVFTSVFNAHVPVEVAKASQLANETANATVKSLIVFGSSLAIGVVTSLLGIALSVGARWRAALIEGAKTPPPRLKLNNCVVIIEGGDSPPPPPLPPETSPSPPPETPPPPPLGPPPAENGIDAIVSGFLAEVGGLLKVFAQARDDNPKAETSPSAKFASSFKERALDLLISMLAKRPMNEPSSDSGTETPKSDKRKSRKKKKGDGDEPQRNPSPTVSDKPKEPANSEEAKEGPAQRPDGGSDKDQNGGTP